MDRKIPQEEITRNRRRFIGKIAVAVLAVAAIIVLMMMFVSPSVSSREVRLAVAETGSLETSIQANGKVVPAFEEIITSPITTRIVEVYSRPGDKVEAGTPLLRLDLQSAQTDIDKLNDERMKQQYAIRQLELSNQTALTSLEMQIKVKEMSVNRLSSELLNERRLDSLGSGTGDRVKEAEYALKTGRIELEQLRKQLANERLAREADEGRLRLDLSILDRSISQQLATLDDAGVKAPRTATLTYIITDVGRQVSQGEKLAVIADLSGFRVDGAIADSRARSVEAGGKAIVKIGNNRLTGTIVNPSPVSSDGTIKFSVLLDNDTLSALRPGLNTEIHVLRDIKNSVIRIPLGAYYSRGPGKYEMFVETQPGRIERRKVTLGDANYEYVEVVDGISAGEKVVVSDMTSYTNSAYIIKN